MNEYITADLIKVLVSEGKASDLAYAINMMANQNKRLVLVGNKLRELVEGDHHWTLEWEYLTKEGKPSV